MADHFFNPNSEKLGGQFTILTPSGEVDYSVEILGLVVSDSIYSNTKEIRAKLKDGREINIVLPAAKQGYLEYQELGSPFVKKLPY